MSFVENTFLDFQHILTHIRNLLVGIRDFLVSIRGLLVEIRDSMADFCNLSTTARDHYMGVDRKLGLEGTCKRTPNRTE